MFARAGSSGCDQVLPSSARQILISVGSNYVRNRMNNELLYSSYASSLFDLKDFVAEEQGECVGDSEPAEMSCGPYSRALGQEQE